MWFVYILKCVDDSYYVGMTNDIEKRLQNHRARNGSQYVSARLTFKLVYTEKHNTKEKAALREAQLKGWTRKKKESLM